MTIAYSTYPNPALHGSLLLTPFTVLLNPSKYIQLLTHMKHIRCIFTLLPMVCSGLYPKPQGKACFQASPLSSICNSAYTPCQYRGRSLLYGPYSMFCLCNSFNSLKFWWSLDCHLWLVACAITQHGSCCVAYWTAWTNYKKLPYKWKSNTQWTLNLKKYRKKLLEQE